MTRISRKDHTTNVLKIKKIVDLSLTEDEIDFIVEIIKARRYYEDFSDAPDIPKEYLDESNYFG